MSSSTPTVMPEARSPDAADPADPPDAAPAAADGAPEPPPDVSVLHLLDTEEYAGRESVVEKLARGQVRAGFDVRVACVVEEGSDEPPFPAAIREAGVAVDVLRLPPRAYLREWRRVAELCGSMEADVLHTHGYRPDVVGGAAAARAGAASVSTVHGFIEGGWKQGLYLALQRFALRRFDAVVAVSGSLAEELARREVRAERLHVVRNAWGGRDDFLPRAEARRRLGVEEGELLAGWVGRVSREKGLDVLLDALGREPAEGVSVSVVGDGPERERLARRARELASDRRVRWHGPIPGAYRLFRAFDVFVLSSRTEGTPMVLLEAMAAGVPVVATRVGGVPDVVSEGEAWLVPPEDPAALAEALDRVRRRPAEAGRRAEAARERLDSEFGLEGWVERYGRVYREAVVANEAEGG